MLFQKRELKRLAIWVPMLAMLIIVPLALANPSDGDDRDRNRDQHDPLISSVLVDYTANTLSISGTNLLGEKGRGVSSVTLSGATPLALMVLGTPSPTSIVAAFPAGSPPSSF